MDLELERKRCPLQVCPMFVLAFVVAARLAECRGSIRLEYTSSPIGLVISLGQRTIMNNRSGLHVLVYTCLLYTRSQVSAGRGVDQV